MQITTVGLDLAKSVFQFHCLDSARPAKLYLLPAGAFELTVPSSSA